MWEKFRDPTSQITDLRSALGQGPLPSPSHSQPLVLEQAGAQGAAPHG